MHHLLCLLLILIALALGSPHPIPQGTTVASAAAPGGSTEATVNPALQCNVTQMAEFEVKQTHCFTVAELAYNETVKDTKLETEAVRKAICKSITDKVQCITALLPICHSKVQTEAVKDQYLISEFMEKYNDEKHTKPFPEFIASCPVLKDNEANVVQLMTGGPNSCTFTEIQVSTSNESLAAWAKCNVDTVEAYNKLLAELESDTKEKIIEGYCSEKKHYESSCREYVKCQSPDAHVSLKQSEKALFEQVEKLIQGHKLPDFTFEKSCTS